MPIVISDACYNSRVWFHYCQVDPVVEAVKVMMN